MKSTIKSLVVGITLCSVNAFGQNPFYWQQYNTYNPGAAGIEDSLSFISSLTFQGKVTSTRNSINYRSAKIHGGLSVGYTGLFNSYWYAQNGLNLNYSFHAKVGKKSTLGIGAGFHYNHYRYNLGENTVHRYNDYTGSFGIHFQSGRLRAGTTFMPRFQSGDFRYQLGWSALYVDYTFKLGENWGLQTGFGGGADFQYLTLSAKYRDRLWFGANLGFGHHNVFAGIQLKPGVTFGASAGVFHWGSHKEFTGSVFLKADLQKLFGR